MANSPILDIPQVSPNQNQKETTLNTAVAILEQAANASASITLAAAPKTLTKAEFTRAFHLRFSGHAVPLIVTLPATARFFVASNEGTGALTLRCAPGTGAAAVLPAGERRLVLSDGVDAFLLSA